MVFKPSAVLLLAAQAMAALFTNTSSLSTVLCICLENCRMDWRELRSRWCTSTRSLRVLLIIWSVRDHCKLHCSWHLTKVTNYVLAIWEVSVDSDVATHRSQQDLNQWFFTLVYYFIWYLYFSMDSNNCCCCYLLACKIFLQNTWMNVVLFILKLKYCYKVIIYHRIVILL